MEYEYKSLNVETSIASEAIDDHIKKGWYVENLWHIGDRTIITFSK